MMSLSRSMDESIACCSNDDESAIRVIVDEEDSWQQVTGCLQPSSGSHSLWRRCSRLSPMRNVSHLVPE